MKTVFTTWRFTRWVGGLEHEFYDFAYIGNVITPIDSYYSEGLKPPIIFCLQISIEMD
jgi:hypothetical protein